MRTNKIRSDLKPRMKRGLMRGIACTALVWCGNVALPALATPDTSVANRQNFSTDVIYQIVTDRFLDGDASNNPTGANYSGDCSQLKLYCGGDWKGIQKKIEDGYLTGMGVSAIWISQPVENITKLINYNGVMSSSYHGYWARDHKHTNPAFGNFTDFSNLIASAHSHNIKVIIDFAPNHSSPANPADPSFAENGCLYDNGVLMSCYSNDSAGIFHHYGGTDFSSLESETYKNLFDLADLDQNSSRIDAYFKSALKLWLDLGVDGVRWDAVKHMPFGWQKNMMSFVNGYKPVFSFGEWYLGTGEVDPANQYFANRSGMSLLDFEFAQTVRQTFMDGSADMNALYAMLVNTNSQYARPSDLVTFIDNHDMARFQVSGASPRKLEQALAFTLTSRGVPAVYYGTEQYMTGTGDPYNRARMTGFNVGTTAYKMISRLAPLRKSNPALAYGSTQQRWVNSNVLIVERQLGNNVALVAINRDLVNSTHISGLITALPAGTYSDTLAGLGLNGNAISVNASGAVAEFDLAPGAVAVWQLAGGVNVPTIAHVGPVLVNKGNIVTLDGRAFGSKPGFVYVGTTAVPAANILSWEDTEIKFVVPSTIAAGQTTVSLRNASSTASNVLSGLEVLSGPQVAMRFVVGNASTNLGDSVYLTGDQFELTNWSSATPLGSMFNQVVYQYPNWYMDVSVPANTAINFKFIKKGATTLIWEGGSNHTVVTPASGTGTVNVNWQN